MKFGILFPVHNPSKKAHPQDKIQACLDAERHEFQKCHNSSYFRPEKHQKSDPKRHKFWERHNSLLPWARESPNATVKDTKFAQNCTHRPQQKCQQNKESICFSRILHLV